jgi:hypothetical protein
MKGYPKSNLSFRDYLNLLSMPEYSTQAKVDLAKLSSVDDSKLEVSVGTEKDPKTEIIDNPMPAWKRAGFKDYSELQSMSALYGGK